MTKTRILAAALAFGATVSVGAQFDKHDQAILADFAGRVQAYAALHRTAALTVPQYQLPGDPAQVRRAANALATVIRSARFGARQGDIFTPEIAAYFRRAIGGGCAEDYAGLLALVTEELEAPLPPPVVHARWPMGAPLPTMPSDLLAALPPLPAELEYRFVSRDLVLRDIDANLIVDFVRDAIPSTQPSR